jgi:L-alanine-DL-glutamate epimerase-like enolase superfamily enzyme
MKITDMKMHILPLNSSIYTPQYFKEMRLPMEYSLIRIFTDEGTEGDYIVWGETPLARSGALAEVLRSYKPFLIGEDPLNRERVWQRLGSLWYGEKGPAFAAVDIALWDIAGKTADVPIYKLLGAYKDSITGYASGLPPSTEQGELSDLARKLKKKGYKAMKIHPISIEDADDFREEVGNEITLMFDAVSGYDRRKALEVGRKLEDLGFYWFEDPLPLHDIEGYVELCEKLEISVTVELFRNHIEYVKRKATDIVRTLIEYVGGITGLKKIANLSEIMCLELAPLSWGGSLNQAANLHVMLSIRNCDFFEVPVDENGDEGIFDVGTRDVLRIDEGGLVLAPTKPGLGLEIDWDLVKEGTEVKL